jgi:hypothetical protein
MLIHQINVAASQEEGGIAGFSNFGKLSVHVTAPGADVLSTTPKDTYEVFSGTSMAAPHVSGMAAMLRSEFPNLSALDVKRVIMDSSTFDADLEDITITGGNVDLQRAFLEAGFVQLGASVAAVSAVSDVDRAPKTVSRKVERSYTEDGRKFPKRQDVEETYTNGVSKKLSMVADHVIVVVEDESVVGALASGGFRIRGRLKTEQPTFLVEAPDGVDAAIAALDAVEGVVAATADYVIHGN